jgi:hypothetical protein
MIQGSFGGEGQLFHEWHESALAKLTEGIAITSPDLAAAFKK